jgi:hydrogenase maturation protease
MGNRALVIGLGNPILGDDGVGWRAAAEVERRIGGSSDHIEVDWAAVGGLQLMERLVGYDCAVIVDAIHTGRQPTGTVSRWPLNDLPDPSVGHSTSAHDTSLQTALAVGRAIGAPLPESVTVITIETPLEFVFSEDLTAPVEAAIPRAASLAVAALHGQEVQTHGIA